MNNYQFSMFERLEPRTPFKGGRITDTDVLTLTEAARFASVHAGTEVTPADILRAGARGEIQLSAIVHQRAKVQMPAVVLDASKGHATRELLPALMLLACCHTLPTRWRGCWRLWGMPGKTCN